MAADNPFEITYAGQAVGGTSDAYQLHGPYVLRKSYDNLTLVFEVVVVGSSFSDLQSKSDTLETAFRKRLAAGETLVIDLDGSSWTYTHGTTLLGARAEINKTGNPETDAGFARSYLVTIEAELPADGGSDGGLRDIEAIVQYAPTRQRTVTVRGTYTATTAGNAWARYAAAADAEVLDYLTFIDNAATWEWRDEDYSLDRNRDGSNDPFPHQLTFTRQYVEVLFEQSEGVLNDTQITDHRVTFTDLSQHPGDSRESIRRLRRVSASYDCGIDIDQTTDLQSVYRNKVREHLKATFRSQFSPQVFAVEENRVSYDETSKRLSVTAQFLYQTEDADTVVEVSQSVAFREARSLDYTPIHDESELAFEVDVGWAQIERVWNRTAIVIGNESPKLRIAENPKAGPAGAFSDRIGGQIGPDSRRPREIKRSGWNVTNSTSQVTDQWLGDPSLGDQIKIAVLTETVVERLHQRAGASSSATLQRAGGV